MNIPLNPPNPQQNIPTRFRYVAACLPDHLAVVDEAGTMTYSALEARSDRLAAHLAACFGTESEPVALLLPNTGLAVLGILGVLKAGKFFVPLDPATEAGAQRTVVRSSTARILLTATALLGAAKAIAGAEIQIIAIDALDLERDAPPLTLELSPGGYASLNFTSGSTGQTKGVVWSHGAWSNRSLQSLHYDHITPDDRIAQLFSPAYTIYSSIVFITLLNGATLCPYPSNPARLRDLFDWLRRQAVTVFFAPVGVLRDQLANRQWLRPLPAVRAVMLSGQRFLYRDLIGLPEIVAPDCAITNRLSMSEFHLVTRYIIDRQDIQPTADPVPVGYPCADSEVMIWDEHGQPVARGETGQIVVRSRYLAPGYWRNPELTAAKFLPDPDGGDRRIFLTGDMGRLRPDGCLEHLGRKDLMVKIRGYRVEPEAIEQALLAHPAIHECVVIPRPSLNGELRLVAYLASHQSPGPTASELRALLAQSLPAYMIPARFVYLESLPRNANGKIDRQVLPPPGRTRPELSTSLVAPRTEVEQQLANTWAELLELDEVGVEDNFFELGGDSLSALRVSLHVEEQFNVNVPPDFFREPTVAHLARLIAGDVTAKDDSLHPAPRMPSSPIVKRARRFTPGNLLRHLTQVGPLWRGYALPYGLGVRLQRVWLATPGVHRALFRTEIELMRRWGELAGEQHFDVAIRQSLLANTWQGWRTHVLSTPLGDSPWVTVQGDPTLWQPRQDGPGVIFLVLHSHLSAIFRRSLAAGGLNALFIRGQTGEAETREQDRSLQVYRAHQTLRRGEVVIIASDGGKGKQGVTVPFFGGQRLFRHGAAELTVQTGALLIPVFCTMATDGRVTIELCAPLTTGSGSSEAQVEALTRAYAKLVMERWPQVYPGLAWGNLARWLRKASPDNRGVG